MKYLSVIIHHFSILKTVMLALNPRLPLAKSVNQSALLPPPCVSWASLSTQLDIMLKWKALHTVWHCTSCDVANIVMYMQKQVIRRLRMECFLILADRFCILMLWSAFCRSSISSVSTSRRHKCMSAKHMFSWCIFKKYICMVTQNWASPAKDACRKWLSSYLWECHLQTCMCVRLCLYLSGRRWDNNNLICFST